MYAGKMCAGGCGFELSSSAYKPVEGKRRHRGNGMCFRCYQRATKAALDEDKALSEVPGLEHMMRARRARKSRRERAEKARAFEYTRYLHYRKTRQPA